MFNRMKVIKSADVGSLDWSPTVQHIERMKRRRQRHMAQLVILVVFAVVLACGSLAIGSLIHLGA
jgi:hypothetical protein